MLLWRVDEGGRPLNCPLLYLISSQEVITEIGRASIKNLVYGGYAFLGHLSERLGLSQTDSASSERFGNWMRRLLLNARKRLPAGTTIDIGHQIVCTMSHTNVLFHVA